MRLAIVISSIARGGMERQVIQLADGLAKRGHQVVLIVLKSIVDYHEEIEAADMEIVELRRYNRTDFRVLTDLVHRLHELRPDAVLCENFNATLWGRLASILRGLPVVTAEHSTDRGAPAKIRVVNRLLAAGTARVVACANAQVESLVLEGNPREKIVVIPNGVDESKFRRSPEAGRRMRDSLGIPDEVPVVGIVAAHRSEKRHDRFIELIELLRKSGLDAWGVMFGGGPLIEETRKLVHKSDAANGIVVAGPQTDMIAAYSAMDISVLVSDAVETFPLASLESQACGVPVAAMEVGGVSETMDAGHSGILVPQGAIGTLADEIVRVLQSPDTLAEMSLKCQAWVAERLSVAAMVEEYEVLFEEVV